MPPWLRPTLFCAALLLSGCSSVQYAVKERFGIHKRDILAARIHEARLAQDEARRQFTSALDQFITVTGHDTGPIGEQYARLQRELAHSEARAAAVRQRIGEVEHVAHALFKEWHHELGEYRDPALRDSSRRQLADTEQRYAALAAALHRSATSMDPVLDRFRDQVLFLKHNLNARALAQLDTNHRQLEAEIGRLIGEMENSIREADAFLAALPPATK